MNISAIKDDIDFLCGSNNVSYPDAAKQRNIKIAYSDVARLIWEASGNWQFDDSNQGDLAIATASLVHAQRDYTMPADLQRLHGVSVLDGAGNYLKLKQIDIHDIDVDPDEYYSGMGTPIAYDVDGRSINLFPTPHSGYATMASGIKLYLERDVSESAITASSATPGFATSFHRILSLAAAIDYIKNDDERALLVKQKARLEEGLVRFYGKRNVPGKTTIRPHGKRRWRNYT
jgi:hypothetical protein